jgi:hypothetical protein
MTTAEKEVAHGQGHGQRAAMNKVKPSYKNTNTDLETGQAAETGIASKLFGAEEQPGWFPIASKLIDDGILKKLSGPELKVWLTILSHENRDTGNCFLLHDTIGEETGYAWETVRKAIRRLTKLGLIGRMERRVAHKKSRSNVYANLSPQYGGRGFLSGVIGGLYRPAVVVSTDQDNDTKLERYLASAASLENQPTVEEVMGMFDTITETEEKAIDILNYRNDRYASRLKDALEYFKANYLHPGGIDLDALSAAVYEYGVNGDFRGDDDVHPWGGIKAFYERKIKQRKDTAEVSDDENDGYRTVLA